MAEHPYSNTFGSTRLNASQHVHFLQSLGTLRLSKSGDGGAVLDHRPVSLGYLVEIH